MKYDDIKMAMEMSGCIDKIDAVLYNLNHRHITLRQAKSDNNTITIVDGNGRHVLYDYGTNTIHVSFDTRQGFVKVNATKDDLFELAKTNDASFRCLASSITRINPGILH